MSITSFTDKNAIFLIKMLFLMPQNLTTWLSGCWKCYTRDRGIEISCIPVSPLCDDCDAMLVPVPYCKLCLTQAGNVRSVLVVENESFCPVNHCHSYTTLHLLLVLNSTPSSKEKLLCQFRCSISECNKQFVTRPICNASVCVTSGGCYIWIDTLWWFAHAQSNNKTINV